MKVFNLTDIETPALKQRNLNNHTVAVGSFLLEPGTSREVEEVQLQHLRPGLQHFVNIGAVAIGDQPPAEYAAVKERAKNRPVAASAPLSDEPPPVSKKKSGG